MIIIFSYKRSKMLLKNLEYLSRFGQEIVVLDDNSKYSHKKHDKYCTYIRSEKNNGRKGYWRQWQTAFDIVKNSDDELFVFMPDDFLKLDFDKITKISKGLTRASYSFNLINDGRVKNFNNYPVQKTRIRGFDCKKVGFNDCGFFTNKRTLKKIGFYINEISNARFRNRPALSSGVGAQLTARMDNKNVKMYSPISSLAYHGDHDSVMHYKERKKNPLISI